jgi:acetolactate synthase regulatory subunit
LAGGDLVPRRGAYVMQPASQEEIVDAAAKRVRMLEEVAAVLETYRAVRAPPRPRPEVAVAAATVCFSARLPAPAAPGSLTRVLEAFHRRGVEVLVATVARHAHAAVVTVTASAAPPEVLELIRADIAAIH